MSCYVLCVVSRFSPHTHSLLLCADQHEKYTREIQKRISVNWTRKRTEYFYIQFSLCGLSPLFSFSSSFSTNFMQILLLVSLRKLVSILQYGLFDLFGFFRASASSMNNITIQLIVFAILTILQIRKFLEREETFRIWISIQLNKAQADWDEDDDDEDPISLNNFWITICYGHLLPVFHVAIVCRSRRRCDTAHKLDLSLSPRVNIGSRNLQYTNLFSAQPTWICANRLPCDCELMFLLSTRS